MLKSKSRNFFYQHERRNSGGFSYFSSKSQSSTWASWELNKVVEWIAAWRACVQICLCSIWMKFKYFTRWLSWFHFSFVFFGFTFRRMKTSKIALLSLVWTNKVARPYPHQKSMTSMAFQCEIESCVLWTFRTFLQGHIWHEWLGLLDIYSLDTHIMTQKTQKTHSWIRNSYWKILQLKQFIFYDFFFPEP